MSNLTPTILQRTTGTPGAADARCVIRRITAAELEAYVQALLAWLPLESLLVSTETGIGALALPPNAVVGRRAGSLTALTAADIDSILGLTQLLNQRAPMLHAHTIGQVDGLLTELAGKAPTNHLHLPTQIRATGVQNGWVLTANNQLGSWAAPPSGGGVGGALTSDLDIAEFALLSGSQQILRFVGGQLFLRGLRHPALNEGTGGSAPQNRQVFVRDGANWVHRMLTSADLTVEEVETWWNNNPSLTAAFGIVKTQVEGRAPASHTHVLNTIDMGTLPVGVADGWYAAYSSTSGKLELRVLPSAGGGVSNPLTSNLNLDGRALVDGANEILKFASGKVILGGREIFPAAIASPAAGHVAVYNNGSSLFENRLLAASEVTVSAIAGLSGATVQAALASLESSKLETNATTDAIAPGSNAARQYANATSVAAAGAVMVSAISDDETLSGAATNVTVSERAIKEYVDTEIAGVGGGGMPAGTSFPGSPSNGDQFLRTDLREVFVYDSGIAAWVGATEREWQHYGARYDPGTGQGAGAYLLGTGATLGFRAPFDVLVTGWEVRNAISDTGTITLRTAPEGGSVTNAQPVFITSSRTASATTPLELGANTIVSIFASGFAVGVLAAYISVRFRRRIEA